MGCCKKDDNNCGLISRVFVYILGFIGIAFSLLTVFSCQFISYSTIPGAVPNTLPSPFLVSESASVGLFRWDNKEDDNDSCTYYTNDQINNFDSAFRTAQIVGYVAVLCAGLSLLLATVEFVCCRFCCSKFFLSFLMIFAMITQALTFAIYTTDNVCTAGRSCTMQNGAIFSIAAASCYFVCSIIVCTTPKPVPWIKRVKADDDDTGCLACCTKKKESEEEPETEEKTMPVTDTANDDLAAAVAAGAAAGAAAAAVVATDDDDEEKDLEKGEENADPEAAPPPAADEADDDEDDDDGAAAPPPAADEETGDAGTDEDTKSEVQSEVPSVTPSEPSQVGEEITLEIAQSMSGTN